MAHTPNHDFSKETDSNFETEATKILQKMTGNANFTTPNPPLSKIETAIEDYHESLGKAKDGTHEDVLRKNNDRHALEDLLTELAGYVETTSAGDDEIMASSGFKLSKTPEHIGPLSKPTGFTVNPGPNKGTEELITHKVPHAKFYVFQYKLVDDKENLGWQTVTSTKRRIIIEGLVSKEEYIFRVAGGGSDSSRIWSDEIRDVIR